MPNKKLFEDDSDEENKKAETFSLNKSYAENYEKWRRKEDYQILKSRYGEETLDSDSASDTSSDENLIEPNNPDFDMDFFRVLAAVRLKHPIINEERKFFRDSYEPTSRGKPNKDDKPITVEDYEKKVLLERGGKYDEEDAFEVKGKQNRKDGSSENELESSSKQKFVFDDGSSDDDDSDIFVKRKNKDSKEGEEDQTAEQEGTLKKNDAIEFLLGKKKNLKNKVDEELLTGLKQQWHTNMSQTDKYLMDYFVNERYLEDEDDNVERAPNHCILDVEPLEEDEKTFDRMEEYETKYRFRFEEPDQDFIRRYPRVIDDSVRKTDTRRKDLREEKKQRQSQEQERREQELKRLKAWKKKEILEKIDKLKKAAGLEEERAFEGIDLDADFDPEQHDSAMANMFDDNYYNEKDEDSDVPDVQDEELKAELQEEYEKLDQLDSMSEGTFKYVDVFPNNYGLTTEEILLAKDRELNKWYSVKKMQQYRVDPSMEKRERKNYAHRATLEHVKAKILPSLYAENQEELLEAEEARRKRRNMKKRERKKKKLAAVVQSLEEEQASSTSTSQAVAKTQTAESSLVEQGEESSEKLKQDDHNDSSTNVSEDCLEETKSKKEKNQTTILTKEISEIKHNRGKKRKRKDNEDHVNVTGTKKIKKNDPRQRRRIKKDKRLKGISDNRLTAYGQDPNQVKKILRQNVQKTNTKKIQTSDCS